jgi:hypothetical protein
MATRMCRRVIGCALVAVIGAHARAGPVLQIVSQSYQMRPQTQTVWFELLFNRPPDFFHADPIGRQADSFWFDIDSDLNLATGLYSYWYNPPLGVDRRLSAYEIWNTGQLVVHLESYGPALGQCPFMLDGSLMHFELPYSLLAVPPGGAGLYYAINVAEYGGTTQQIMVVPLPRAAGAGCTVLAAIGLWRAARRARRTVVPA